MGFSMWWVHLVLQSVTTVQYTIMHGEYEMGLIIPMRGIRQGDPLSPNLFIICAEADTSEASNVLQLLNVYENASGQKVNIDKSSVFFRRNKSAMLGFLKDKVMSKIRRWDGKTMARSGNEILVKSVVQTLPSYAMSVFLLPLQITKDIEKSLPKFWWTSKPTNSSHISWMS
ncbi:uncharacterized protein LOC141674254 [Apium graveolens]|uniref:uncharacterized protein LOC141674254 n=1 Tax=Apium graveolens TaxID=4045 RepID=UPI003D794D2C